MLAQADGAGQREGVAHARLFLVGRANPDVVGEFARDFLEHFDAGGVDAVVVGEEDFHRFSISQIVMPNAFQHPVPRYLQPSALVTKNLSSE